MHTGHMSGVLGGRQSGLANGPEVPRLRSGNHLRIGKGGAIDVGEEAPPPKDEAAAPLRHITAHDHHVARINLVLRVAQTDNQHHPSQRRQQPPDIEVQRWRRRGEGKGGARACIISFICTPRMNGRLNSSGPRLKAPSTVVILPFILNLLRSSFSSLSFSTFSRCFFNWTGSEQMAECSDYYERGERPQTSSRVGYRLTSSLQVFDLRASRP